MAMLFYATNSVGPGNRAIVSPQDSITIGPQASLVSTDQSYAVSGTGSVYFQRLFVEGYVLGAGGISWTSGLNLMIGVGATGVVEGYTGHGMVLTSATVALTNSGTISGLYGVTFTSDQIQITNHGLISSAFNGGYAVSVASSNNVAGNEPLVINYGRMISPVVAYRGDFDFGDRLQNYGVMAGRVLHVGGDDSLLNRGTINGDIDMGADNDSLDNRNGTIDGDIDLGAGNDVLDTRGGTISGQVLGGAGNDRFILNARADEIIFGGSETDTVQFSGGTGAVFALDGSLANAGEALGDEYAEIERFIGAASGRDVMRGDATANQFFGRGDDDRLDGAGGADVLTGGQGNDTLIGGLGNDVFRFVQLTDCGDSILDFSGAAGNNDKMTFAGQNFGGIAAGPLAAASFLTRADNVAQDANDRFIFRTTDRSLWFDADGNGAGAAVMVVDLQAGATLTVGDILIL